MAEQETTSDAPSHDAGTAKGEEKSSMEGKEPGRHDHDEDAGGERPAGGSTARNSTSINPEDRDPIDPNSPNMPPA
ncbi:MAG: hypothetical protein WCD76_03760 [Pyrinomonadaceae bacterium]